MPSRHDGVITITSMAAVGMVFDFLGGVVADTEAAAGPIAAIAFPISGQGKDLDC